MFTKEQIHNQLKEMNAPQNKIVLAHSSLKAVGEVEGRGEGLLEALIEYFTADGGLFCVPTHTWAYLLDENRFSLDMLSNETCIGTLPNIAAGHPKAHRSAHPTHSIAVFGNDDLAEELIKEEQYCNSPASPKSAHGKIYDRDGYILLIGVGHNRNTYIHCVEEILNVPNRLSPHEVPTKIRLKSGEIYRGKTHYHLAEGIRDVSAHYPKYEPAFRHYNCITDGFVGNAKTQLVSARKIKDIIELIHQRSGDTDVLIDDKPLDEALYK
ncbi:MAG: AAC(3) family N-acetyltransferase [Clostridia bacterium]|nr:AAC(3) family N-acetyltransferase [Clostridia bacterium]